MLDCLAALGVYQEGWFKSWTVLITGAMTNMVKDKPVTAHVFEYTTSFALDPDLHFKYPDKGIVPCQIIFCMKEKNVEYNRLSLADMSLTYRQRRSTVTVGFSTRLPRCSR